MGAPAVGIPLLTGAPVRPFRRGGVASLRFTASAYPAFLSMPQYEFESADLAAPALHRGRTAADAVARALGAKKGDVDVSEDADEQGWQAVTVAGEPAGRIRDHAARMRFRRD